MSRQIPVRISEWSLGSNGILTLKVFDEDQAIYSSNAVGEAVSRPAESIGLPGSTRLMLLDIPILRDKDNASGYYMAVHGFGSAWTGAAIYISTDGGATYFLLTTATKNTAMGIAATVLADGPTTIYDLTNTVDVTLFAGDAIFSVSKIQWLSGENAAILGNEIIAFQTATQIDSITWRLSGLIRGVAGTEWATAGHAAGERFCILSPDTNLRIADELADLNLARSYKPVSLGASLEDTAAIAFTDTGVGLKPWSPVKIVGDGASDRVITWHRRSRVRGSNWRDFFDPPVGESTESYEIDVLSDDEATVLRTIGATGETATYTAAEQTTDFGAPKAADSIHVKVYQISSAVGRGYPGSGVV